MSLFKLKYNPTCPIDIFNHPHLNNNEKMIYIVIHSIIGANEKKCTLTNDDISNASGTAKRTVISTISKLQELELIWIDVDRKRVSKNPNEAVRHIYTNYKYYVDRNKKAYKVKIPTFKDNNHFRNWCKKYAQNFPCTIKKEDGAKVPIIINKNGHLENTVLNRPYDPTREKETIYYLWEKLYENNEIVTKWVLDKESTKGN